MRSTNGTTRIRLQSVRSRTKKYPFLSKCPEHFRPSISNRMFSIVES